MVGHKARRADMIVATEKAREAELRRSEIIQGSAKCKSNHTITMTSLWDYENERKKILEIIQMGRM